MGEEVEEQGKGSVLLGQFVDNWLVGDGYRIPNLGSERLRMGQSDPLRTK